MSASLTVSELNGMIRDAVAAGVPEAVWVCGEIQNLDRNRARTHLFFDLVEKDPGGRDLRAKVGAVIWGGVRPRIEALLKRAENAFDLRDGIEVRVSGRVDFYAPYGTVRFIIDAIDPVHTLGKIAQDRRRLIAELESSGALGRNKALVLAPVPLRVGLVTAHESAAYNDFIDELRRSGYAFIVDVRDTLMQGKNCEASVAAGVRAFGARDDIDVIVVTRGGGSLADLGPFDSRGIALAVAESRHPVLTGIGHEINTSVADLAAHTVAKTPTAAAQLLAGRVRSAVEALDARHAALQAAAALRLSGAAALLRRYAGGLRQLTDAFVDEEKARQARLQERLRQAPGRAIARRREVLAALGENMARHLRLRFRAAHTTMEHHARVLTATAPERVLRRGFSITRGIDGKALRSATDALPGQEIHTELHQGTVLSRVSGVVVDPAESGGRFV